MSPARDGALLGRSALVTGASRGIGAAVARSLAREGARVALLARSETALRALADEIGGDALVVPCDVRDTNATERAADTLIQTLDGGPDIVVNNAGAFMIAAAHKTSVADFRSTLEINLLAPFALVRAFLPAMRKRARGHVVNIGSVADRAIFPGNAAYSASKYGLRAMHEVLLAELRGTGVRASLVSPGPVDTALWDEIDPDNKPGFTPRAQMLSPEAVADAVLFVVTAPATTNIDELRLSRS